VPLTLDYGAFAQSLDAVDVGHHPARRDALTAAIDASLEAFEGRQGSIRRSSSSPTARTTRAA
jgi:hypothetical protein